jgi:hypothetical protein
MTCPNGMTIPADGSGGWCIGDPISTTELDPLYDAIDLSLTVSVSVEVEAIVEDSVDDPAVLLALNQILNEHGLADVTAQIDVVLPEISMPVYDTPGGDTDDDGSTGGDYSSSQCSSYITCEVCSISACVAATQASCTAGYKTSDGQYFQCSSCEDCYSAAEAATNYCCPVPQ